MPINIKLDPPPTRRPLQEGDLVDFVWAKWFQSLTDIVVGASGTFFNYVLLPDGSPDYDVQAKDTLIFAQPDSADININLTPGVDGKVYRIKNLAATGANSVNVFPFGSEEIERTTSLVLAKGDAATIMFVAPANGWFII